jgi:hypothetical protein
MSSSPVNGGKLYFSAYLRGEGAPLLRAMTQAGKVSEAYVFQLLNAMPALEIYLPVDEHRAQWTGGDDLIVAASLDEENAPFGVRLDGQLVRLSVETPPSTPTVAIVPAESFNDFGAAYDWALRKAGEAARPNRSTGSAIGGPSFSTSAAEATCPYDAHVSNPTWQRNLDVEEYMSCVRAWNDHEPWWKDDAEFSVMITGTSNTDNQAELTNNFNIPPEVWTNSGGTGSWKNLPFNLKVGLWATDFGTRVHIKCLERDGGGTYTWKVTGSTEFGAAPLQTTVGFEHGYTYKDDDDPCGEYYITLRLSDGRWTQIPNGVSPEYDGTSDLQWYGFGVQY